jgi:MoaA/NifB/PqqE/SkfB family radical SAM enzyme
MTNPSRTFCVLPWLHAATLTDGSVQLCCVSGGGSGVNLNEQTLGDYWNSEYVKDARRRMLAGQEVKACQHCYEEERCGYKSHRIVENKVWQKRCGTEAIQQLLSKTTADGSLDAALQYVDLRLGNTCNMQCVMCQPRESSRWLPAARKLSASFQNQELKREWRFRSMIDVGRFEWYRNTAFWENLKTFLPHVKEIIVAGGEPFLIKEQFDFVKACCEIGEAHHIRLRYHTNGTVFPEAMVPYWEQFENVHFFVSLDGIDDVANYVRYPSDWEAIENNIRHFDALGENTTTNFNFTTHALNIYRIPEIFDWAAASGLRNRKYFADMQEYVSTSLVHHPAYQTVRVLPGDCKRLVTKKIEAYMEKRLDGQRVDKLTAILSFMNSEDHSHKMPSLVEYTKMLDITRGTDFVATFPELSPYWMGYNSVPKRAMPATTL